MCVCVHAACKDNQQIMKEVAVHHKSRSAGLPQFVMNLTEVHHKIILSSRPWISFSPILFIPVPGQQGDL